MLNITVFTYYCHEPGVLKITLSTGKGKKTLSKIRTFPFLYNTDFNGLIEKHGCGIGCIRDDRIDLSSLRIFNTLKAESF